MMNALSERYFKVWFKVIILCSFEPLCVVGCKFSSVSGHAKACKIGSLTVT